MSRKEIIRDEWKKTMSRKEIIKDDEEGKIKSCPSGLIIIPEELKGTDLHYTLHPSLEYHLKDNKTGCIYQAIDIISVYRNRICEQMNQAISNWIGQLIIRSSEQMNQAISNWSTHQR